MGGSVPHAGKIRATLGWKSTGDNMLDVHAPEHPIGGTRDFLVHLFTITVGLLIALGLENAAEAMHHRHQRKEAETNIRQELQANRDMLLKSAPNVLAERDNLIKVITALEAISSGTPSSQLHGLQVNFDESPIPDSAWTTASSTGVLSYMEYSEVQTFADAYKQQGMLQAEEEQALEDYLEFSPLLEMHHKDLTPALANEALPAVRRALAHVSGMLAIGAGTKSSYDDALK